MSESFYTPGCKEWCSCTEKGLECIDSACKADELCVVTDKGALDCIAKSEANFKIHFDPIYLHILSHIK